MIRIGSPLKQEFKKLELVRYATIIHHVVIKYYQLS